jgi:hypothetical protein
MRPSVWLILGCMASLKDPHPDAPVEAEATHVYTEAAFTAR